MADPALARSWPLLACLLLAAAAPAHHPAGKPVELTQQPGTALDSAARSLAAADLKEASRAGDPVVLLVGSARLATAHGAPAALFVQVQSAGFCGSAGCSTTVFARHGDGWRKILDAVSGPIQVAPTTHGGMHDLLVHAHDRWVWNGRAYVDTLPTPAVDLRPAQAPSTPKPTAPPPAPG